MPKVPLVSQDQWAPPDLPVKVALDFLDHQAPLDLSDLPDTPLPVNPAAPVPPVNPDPTVNPATEEPLERPALWAHEELLDPPEHRDLLDSHLSANPDHPASPDQWDQEESPV